MINLFFYYTNYKIIILKKNLTIINKNRFILNIFNETLFILYNFIY
jgi:hypothetical protein